MVWQIKQPVSEATKDNEHSDSAHIVETSVHVKMMRSQISKMKTDIGLIKKIVVSQSVEAKMEKM